MKVYTEASVQIVGQCYPFNLKFFNAIPFATGKIISSDIRATIQFPTQIKPVPPVGLNNYTDDGFYTGNCTY